MKTHPLKYVFSVLLALSASLPPVMAEPAAVASTSPSEKAADILARPDPAAKAAALVLLTAAPALIKSMSSPYPVVGSVERLDPALDALLPPDAVMEKLAEGFHWSEGPLWVPAQSHLLFSDVPENRVYRWKEGEGISVFLEVSGFTGTD